MFIIHSLKLNEDVMRRNMNFMAYFNFLYLANSDILLTNRYLIYIAYIPQLICKQTTIYKQTTTKQTPTYFMKS